MLLQLRSAAHDLPRAVLIGPDVRILCLGVHLGQLFPQRVLVKDTPASAGCAPFQLLRFESVLPALSPRRDLGSATLGGSFYPTNVLASSFPDACKELRVKSEVWLDLFLSLQSVTEKVFTLYSLPCDAIADGPLIQLGLPRLQQHTVSPTNHPTGPSA